MLQFSQFIDEVAIVAGTGRRTGDPLRTSIGRWVNQTCRKFAYAYPWWTRLADQEVVTVAPYATGTVTVTESSTTVTGSGTTFTSGMVGRKFTLSHGGPTYRIATYVGATEITLSTAYREDTASGSGYVIYQDEYDFSASTHSLEEVNLLKDRSYGPLTLSRASRLLQLDYPGTSTGRPTHIAQVASTTAGTPRFRVWPIPDDVYRMVTLYTPKWTDLSADADTPALPDELEALIIDGALRNVPRIEGSRRVPSDAEVRAELHAVYLRSRQIADQTGQRRGFDQAGGGGMIVADTSGVVTA